MRTKLEFINNTILVYLKEHFKGSYLLTINYFEALTIMYIALNQFTDYWRNASHNYPI